MINELTASELLFAGWAFLFGLILVFFFALRKWKFQTTVRYGWVMYAFSIPAALISMVLLVRGMDESFWLAGFLCLAWGIFGYTIEYIKEIRWRNPVRWSILLPYVLLYLGTIMFYWWPLGLISRQLWFAYAVLVMISTTLNIISHKGD
jgi:hypothetical protein